MSCFYGDLSNLDNCSQPLSVCDGILRLLRYNHCVGSGIDCARDSSVHPHGHPHARDRVYSFFGCRLHSLAHRQRILHNDVQLTSRHTESSIARMVALADGAQYAPRNAIFNSPEEFHLEKISCHALAVLRACAI